MTEYIRSPRSKFLKYAKGNGGTIKETKGLVRKLFETGFNMDISGDRIVVKKRYNGSDCWVEFSPANNSRVDRIRQGYLGKSKCYTYADRERVKFTLFEGDEPKKEDVSYLIYYLI